MTAAEKVVQVVMAHLKIVLVSTVNSCSTFCWPHHMAVNSSGQLKIDGVRKEKERLTAASFFWPFLVTAVNQSFSFPVQPLKTFLVPPLRLLLAPHIKDERTMFWGASEGLKRCNVNHFLVLDG